jgi:hypothetical protein
MAAHARSDQALRQLERWLGIDRGPGQDQGMRSATEAPKQLID